MNTAIIISTQIGDGGDGNFAAKLAADYSVQDNGVDPCTSGLGSFQPPAGEICHGDWYLPSKIELNLLYQQKSVVGGFANVLYWSSSENNSISAWDQDFGSGDQNGEVKHFTLEVRAVRAF